MIPEDSSDGGRNIDWSKASIDYARHRPGFPPSFFQRLEEFGIGQRGLRGQRGQRVLDLGTGTGALAREFAKRGLEVTGVDIAEGQIEQARNLARADNLEIDFICAPAEKTGLPDCSFDVISAGQCWQYFNKRIIAAEIKRMLAEGGKLLICHFCWLPRQNMIARKTEELVIRFNPQWSGGDWDGTAPEFPDDTTGDFELLGKFVYDEEISFNRESWRGRIRACRGVAVTLPPDKALEFDAEHTRLLEEIADSEFTVLHRIDAHILKSKKVLKLSNFLRKFLFV